MIAKGIKIKNQPIKDYMNLNKIKLQKIQWSNYKANPKLSHIN